MAIIFRPLWSFTAVMALLFAGMTALGAWQLERLQWKLGLIAAVQRNLAAPPLTLDRLLTLPPGAAQYHRVALTGRFDNAKEAYAFTTGPDGAPAYHVLTPFVLGDGRALLVDRGYVPARLRDPKTRTAGEVSGERRVVGVWRIPDAPGLFTPAPDLVHRIWYSRDLASIAKVDGIHLAAPALVEADAAPNPGGLPRGGQTVVAFRNEHLQYAITWFAMAAIVLGGWIAYHISRGRIAWTRGRP
jgi:surfeit locus 1 family protein